MTGRDRFLAARDLLLRHATDYEAARREFRWPELDQFNWALDHFDPVARDNDRLALVVVHEGRRETRTWGELRVRSNQVANLLVKQGVGFGTRVLLMLPNVAALWEAMLACMKIGAVIVPATTQLTPRDVEDRVSRGRVSAVVCESASSGKIDPFPGFTVRVAVGDPALGWTSFEAAAAEPSVFVPERTTRADDPMLLYFTSGTTAKPKLVLHTHQSYPVGHLTTMYWIGLRPGDVHWNISSPGWAKHAWSNVFAPWNAGATVVATNLARFSATRLLETLTSEGVTTLCAPPTVLRMLILEDLAATKVGVREIVAAGEPLNPEVIERVRAAWGITIRDGFGQTETSALIGNSPGQRVIAGSMGRPLPGFEIELLGPTGAPETEGEVAVRASPRPTGLLAGYDEEGGLRDAVGPDGWYRTGDVASRDDAGYVTYVGRADDVFKSSDYRISPFELESVLLEHPAVAEAAVVPCPDPLRLAVPKAFVALAPGVEPSPELGREILAFVRERVAPFKRIRRIEFRELPKTISGKIRRVELRQLEAERATAGAGPGEEGAEEQET